MKIGQDVDGGSDLVKAQTNEGHWPELLPPTAARTKLYKLCKECARQKKNNTAYHCSVCLVPLHPHCFKSYHDKQQEAHFNNVTDTFEDGTFDFDDD